MVDKLSTSVKFSFNILWLGWQSMHNIPDNAGSSFSCSLVFYMAVVSLVLYTDNPVTISPFEIPSSRLLVFEVYSFANFKIR